MKVARNIPMRLKKRFRACTHQSESVIESFVSCFAARFSSSDIVNIAPKSVCLSVNITVDNIFYQTSAVAVGNPFKRRVPACMEHKTVIHIVCKKIFVINGCLAQNCPIWKSAFKDAAFAFYFCCGIIIVRARHNRVSHARPRMAVIAVPVHGNC